MLMLKNLYLGQEYVYIDKDKHMIKININNYGFGHLETVLVGLVVSGLVAFGLIASNHYASAAPSYTFTPVGDVKLGNQPFYLYACYFKNKTAKTVKYSLLTREEVDKKAGKNTSYNPIMTAQVSKYLHLYDNWHSGSNSAIQNLITNNVNLNSNFRLGIEGKGKDKPNLQWGPVYSVLDINNCKLPSTKPNL